MKLKFKILLSLFVLFLVWFIVISSQTYQYPDRNEIDKRLNYLERVINQPLDSDSEILLLGTENYEFMLFSYSYSTYAATNLTVKDSTYKNRSIALIKESILKVLDNRITSSYGIDEQLFQLDSIPENYSVLYLGHLNLMLGCYRLLSSDSTFNRLNDKISESLFCRYNKTEYLNLESYSSAIWIPDNTVAIASLKLHGFNSDSEYDSICEKWVEYAKLHYLDKETGVLYSTIDPATGKAKEEPRGSMLGWSIMFIYQFDEIFAKELYFNYKKNFSNNWGVLRLFNERFQNNNTNIGDIDSGPIFWGYSIPANEFALGNAVLAEDYRTARQLERLINIGTSRIEENNEMRYNVKFIEMNISPMAEALVLNSLTIVRWIE